LATATEKRLAERKRAVASGALLVPILEELLENEVIPEDQEDYDFLDMLVRARSLPRQKGVFSPSQLGSCVRQAYFAKRGTEKHLMQSPRANGYFLHGNFIHFKWQFALWKAHRAKLLDLPLITDALGERHAVEVRVSNRDFTGTIDAIVAIDGIYHVVDFKGINLIEYQRTIKRGANQQYRKQIVGYAMTLQDSLPKIELGDCLLICENKAGPIAGSGSPIALHETRVPIKKHQGEVTRRLKTLRWYDGKGETPEAECVSTQHMQYQECPFSRFCREEVLDNQRELERRAQKRRGSFKVNRPGR
jgi:hypothetical protein